MAKCCYAASFLLLVLQVVAKKKVEMCQLPCRNGGICTSGRQTNNSSETKTGYKNAVIVNDRQYCSCPRGYTGVTCEIKYIPCNGGFENVPIIDEKKETNDKLSDNNNTADDVVSNRGPTCFNGETCLQDIDNKGEMYYHCECDATVSDLSTKSAFRFCQHAATSFCKRPDLSPDQIPGFGRGGAGGSYCSNGGRCKKKDDQIMTMSTGRSSGSHHAGCICTSQWTGSHCETPTEASFEQRMSDFSKEKSSSNAGVGSLISLSAFCSMVSVVGFFWYRKNQRYLQDEEIERQRCRERRRAVRRYESSKKKRMVVNFVGKNNRDQDYSSTRFVIDEFESGDNFNYENNSSKKGLEMVEMI